MYILTYLEFDYKSDKWIEMHRMCEDTEELKDFMSFLYETYCVMREVHVWKATEIEFRPEVTATVRIFEE